MRPLGSPPFKQLAWRTFKCKVCGQEFRCSREDGQYCGATCRQRERRLKLAAARMTAEVPATSTINVPTRVESSQPVTPKRSATRAAKSSAAKSLRKKGKPSRTKPARKKGKKK